MSEFISDDILTFSNNKQSELEPSVNRQRLIKAISKIAISSVEYSNKNKRSQEVQQNTISDFEARPYQIEAWLRLREARQSGNDRGLINLATGLGKTTIATFDYAMFRKERLAEGKTAKGLFVVHQNNILKQAGNSFQNLMPDLNIKRYHSNKTDSLNADFSLATFQSLKVGIENGTIDENEFDYIVYDEAHHIEAGTYKQVVEHLKPAFQLGLTATPKRMDEKDITEHFGEALYTKTLPEAIVDGYLATVDYNLMIDDAVQQMIDENFNPETISEINDLFDHEPRNEEIVKNILSEQQKIKANENTDKVKTIIFCSNKKHADEIAEMMNGVSYHSGAKNQDDIMKLFRNGDIDAITAVNMFNEGVDIPDTRMIVFLRTTQSSTLFEQQLGRGLRKTADKDKVTVLDFVANIDRVSQVNELSNKISEIIDSRAQFNKSNTNGTTEAFTYNANFLFDKKTTNLIEKYYKLLDTKESRTDLYLLSNDELVDLWQKSMSGKKPTQRLINQASKECRFLNSSALETRFGSMINFQIACGYEAALLSKTNNEIVATWQELMPDQKPTQRLINQLSKEHIFLSNSALEARFGNMINFQIACGYEAGNSLLLKNKQELVDIWQEKMPNDKPTVRLIEKLSREGIFVSSKYIVSKFDNLVNFQKACGYKNENSYTLKSNQELIDIWQEKMPGIKPSRESIDELSKKHEFSGRSNIISRFGNISNFQIACGYKK